VSKDWQLIPFEELWLSIVVDEVEGVDTIATYMTDVSWNS
jgi:hypothetical protein